MLCLTKELCSALAMNFWTRVRSVIFCIVRRPAVCLHARTLHGGDFFIYTNAYKSAAREQLSDYNANATILRVALSRLL